MAKKIIIQPKKNVKVQVKNLVNKGPQKPGASILEQGPSKNKVQQVEKSKIPNPSQNQRGRILSKDDRDLTR